MARDTTLDAFHSADAANGTVQITMTITPDGESCAVCGRSVRRRWRDEAGLVCAECKHWHRS